MRVEEVEDLLNGFMWSIREIMISVGDRETNPNQIIRWEIVAIERECQCLAPWKVYFPALSVELS